MLDRAGSHSRYVGVGNSVYDTQTGQTIRPGDPNWQPEWSAVNAQNALVASHTGQHATFDPNDTGNPNNFGLRTPQMVDNPSMLDDPEFWLILASMGGIGAAGLATGGAGFGAGSGASAGAGAGVPGGFSTAAGPMSVAPTASSVAAGTGAGGIGSGVGVGTGVGTAAATGGGTAAAGTAWTGARIAKLALALGIPTAQLATLAHAANGTNPTNGPYGPQIADMLQLMNDRVRSTVPVHNAAMQLATQMSQSNPDPALLDAASAAVKGGAPPMTPSPAVANAAAAMMKRFGG